MRNSLLPPSDLIFQTNADLSGAYCTLPVAAYERLSVSSPAKNSRGNGTHSELGAVGIIRHRHVDFDVVR